MPEYVSVVWLTARLHSCHVAIDVQLGQEGVCHAVSHAQLQPPFETHFHAGKEWTTRPIRARKREINHIERLLSRWPMPSCARAHRRAPGVRSYERSVQRGRDGKQPFAWERFVDPRTVVIWLKKHIYPKLGLNLALINLESILDICVFSTI